MALPLIFMIALQAAAMAAQRRAQSEVMGERNSVNLAESLRQENLGKKATDINTDVQDTFKRDNQESIMADAFKQRAKTIQRAAPRPEGFTGSMRGGPEIVNDEIARKIGQAAEFSGQQGDALAGIRSYGDLGSENAVNLLESARKLGGVAESSRRSSNILPMELQAAEQAGQKYRSMADLFRLASTAAGIYGMTSGGAPEIRNPLYTYQTPVPGVTPSLGAPW